MPVVPVVSVVVPSVSDEVLDGRSADRPLSPRERERERERERKRERERV